MSPDPRRPSKSQRQAQGREQAREKARRLREQEARAARRKRVGLVTLGALVAAGLVALLVATLWDRTEESDSAGQLTPTSFTEDGAFVVGQEDAPVVVDVYADYQCPFCRTFELDNADYLEQQRSAGSVAVAYHPMSILGDYSTRAASAAVCVAEEAPEQFVAFNEALYAEQPPEDGGAGLTDDEVAAIADEAGVPSDVGCITTGAYADWVEQATADRDERVEGTPTVLVAGEVVEDPVGTPANLRAAVDAALGAGATSSGAP